jgi:hypothetical protein
MDATAAVYIFLSVQLISVFSVRHSHWSRDRRGGAVCHSDLAEIIPFGAATVSKVGTV